MGYYFSNFACQQTSVTIFINFLAFLIFYCKFSFVSIEAIGNTQSILQYFYKIKSQDAISQDALPDQQYIMHENSQSTIKTNALKQYENIYLCPITMELMNQPYALPCQHTFELQQIRKQLQQKEQCPLCRKHFKFQNGAKNLLAKQGIEIYKKQIEKKNNKYKKQQISVSYLLIENSSWCTFIDKDTTFRDVIKMMIEKQQLGLSIEDFRYYVQFFDRKHNYSIDKTIFSQFQAQGWSNEGGKCVWGKMSLFSLKWYILAPREQQFYKLVKYKKN